MEESSNGKSGEIQKVEKQDWEKELSGEFKTGPEVESVKVIVDNGNPESVTENRVGDDSYEAESNENSTQKVDSGEVEGEIVVNNSVVDSVEHEVSSPSEELTECVQEVLVQAVKTPDDVSELKSMVIEENIPQRLNETDRDSKVIEETNAPSLDANDGASSVETEVLSKAVEEIHLASSEEGAIEQIKLPSSDYNCEVPPAAADAVSKAVDESNPEESSSTADLESKEKVDDLPQEAANAGSVVNNPEIPASTENQPVTSLSRRTIQPTSWRSCCGLLEILRRSDR